MKRHLLLFFVFFGLFFSCHTKGSLSVKRGTAQVIHINYAYSPFSPDPRKGTDPVTTVLSYMLYEGLTRLEPDGTVIPALAEKIHISEDRKEYLFFLKKSMWSNGSPLTAHHFEISWKKILSPDFPSKAAHLLFVIDNAEQAKMGLCSIDDVGVKAIDQHTLLVRLKKPTPYFLELTAYPTYFPVSYNGEEVFLPNQSSDLLTNGPFRLSVWKNDDEIVVVKNPYYWNAQEVKLERIHATIIADEATVLNLFEQGKVDYLGGLISPIPLDAVARFKNMHSLKHRPIAGTTFVFFNLEQFPFNNLYIRKAFDLAVNKEEIIDHVSQMFDDVAWGPVPQILKKRGAITHCSEGTSIVKGLNVSFVPLEELRDSYFRQVYDHVFPMNLKRNQKSLHSILGTHVKQKDINRAQSLHYFERGLKELGITREELSLTYCYFNTELQRNLALALQNQWREVLGVQIKLQTNEFKSHLEILRKRQFQMGQMSWIGQYYDPMCFLERFASKDGFANYSGWEDSYYQHLLESSFCNNQEKREKLLYEAEKKLIDATPMISLYHYHAVYINNPRVKDLALSPMGDVQFHRAFVQ